MRDVELLLEHAMVPQTNKFIRRERQTAASNRRWGRIASVALALSCSSVALFETGCTRSSPYLASSPSGFTVPGSPFGAAAGSPEAAQYAAQVTELERRAKLLDDNNRQLHTQLAQSQQQMQIFKERSELMQRQLGDISNQLQQSRMANAQSNVQLKGLADRVQGLQSATVESTPRRGSAKLTANTSSKLSAEPIRHLGFDVDTEGGVIRLRVPSDQLFQPNTAQLTPSAASTLDRIAVELKTHYPQQRIGIEGHTDNSPLYGGAFANSHQLAAAQSNAILEQLTRRNQISPTQFFTLAHGSNYPITDNQTPVSRATNRRIEFVVYPESN